MDEKKNTIITIRSTSEKKKILEEIAKERKWSISKLVEEIINSYINPEEAEVIQKDEAQKAARLIEIIESQKKLNITMVTKLAIENNLLYVLKGLSFFIEKIIEEHNQQIENTQE